MSEQLISKEWVLKQIETLNAKIKELEERIKRIEEETNDWF